MRHVRAFTLVVDDAKITSEVKAKPAAEQIARDVRNVASVVNNLAVKAN